MTDLRAILTFLERDVKRVMLVVALATFVLAESLPNAVLFWQLHRYGDLHIRASGDRVVATSREVERAGIHVGDRIDPRANSLDERTYIWGSRMPRIGTHATVRVLHDGVARNVTLVATERRPNPVDWYSVWSLPLKKTGALVLVLIAVALVLVRPTRVTTAFFLYAIGSAAAGPLFYSFLPAPLYISLSWFFTITALSVIAPIGFLMVALRLPADPPTGWRRICDRAAPYVAMALALLHAARGLIFFLGFGTLDTLDDFLKLPDLFSEANTGSALFFVGEVSLIGAILNRRLPLRPGVRWAMAAFVLATLPQFLEQLLWKMHAIDPILSVAVESAQTVNILASSLVAYMLIRNRIIDVRFVVNRSLLYGGLVLTIVFASAAVNMAFAKQLTQFAVVIPFEIVGALVLGYRLSGFSDVSTALALADVEAPAAGQRGRRAEEREILARALGRAERTRRANLIAEVRARAAFGAWIAGEGDEFKWQAVALDQAVGDRSLRGLGFFATAANGELGTRTPLSTDLSEWVARGYLIACGNSDDAAQARGYAESAVAAADASGIPFLRAVTRVALAEFAPADRSELYAAAAQFAELAESPELQEAISALGSGRPDLGILTAFVLRLRAPRQENALLEVSFLTATVRSCGVSVTLRESERALLFAVAHDPEPVPISRLADTLWPDLDGDAAANAFRVCLHRLRRGLGDPFGIARKGRGYALRQGAVVDLWSILETLVVLRTSSTLSDEDRKELTEVHARLRAGRAARASQGPWFERYAADLERLAHDAALKLARDAIRREDSAEALRLAQAMSQDDPLDEVACELAIRAHLGAGERALAVREYRRYLGVLAGDGVESRTAALEALLGVGSETDVM